MSRTQTHTEDMRKTFEKLKASGGYGATRQYSTGGVDNHKRYGAGGADHYNDYGKSTNECCKNGCRKGYGAGGADQYKDYGAAGGEKPKTLLNVIQHLLEEIADLKQKLKDQERSNPEVRKGFNAEVENNEYQLKGKTEKLFDKNCKGYGLAAIDNRNANESRSYAEVCRKGCKVEDDGGYGVAGREYQTVDRDEKIRSFERKLRNCRYCDQPHIWGSTNCAAYGRACHKCGKLNHYSRVCWGKPKASLRNNCRPEGVPDTRENIQAKCLLKSNEDSKDIGNQMEVRNETTLVEELTEAVEEAATGTDDVKVESGIERKAEEAPDTGSRNEDDTEESDVESNFKINRKTFDAKYPCMLKYCPIWFHNEFGQEYMDKWLEQKKEEIETEEEAIFYQQEVENMIKNLTPYDPESEQYMIIVGMLQEGKLSMQEIKEQLNEAEEERK